MSSYTYLFTSASAEPVDASRSKRAALCAKYGVALFWFALLDKNATRSLHVVDPEQWVQFGPDGEEYEVPDRPPEELFLTLPLRQALTLYDQRQSLFFEIIPPRFTSIWAELRQLLARSGGRYLHFNPGDIAYMDNDGIDGWQNRFDLALQALDSPPHTPTSGLFARLRQPALTDGWTTLLGMSGIATDRIGQVSPWLLAGLGETIAAPWQQVE